MKTIAKLSIVLSLIALLVMGSAFSTQRDSFSKTTSVSTLNTQSDIIIAGCVGQCGYATSGGYVVQVPGNRTYRFTANSNLCAALGAKAFLRKNGATVFVGDVSNGADMTFTAKKGDVIQLDAELFLKARIFCYPRGQVDLRVQQMN